MPLEARTDHSPINSRLQVSWFSQHYLIIFSDLNKQDQGAQDVERNLFPMKKVGKLIPIH